MGVVYLVGAGPGDPELITVKAVKVLAKADVVLYDRLVNPEILRFAVRAKELIDVGKRLGEASKQELVNKLLVELARRYEVVVRLKNGDPILFGRGAEECEFVRSHGIRCEFIPGITSALAAPTYAGIPVTRRGYSSSVAITTGVRAGGRRANLKRIFSAVDTVIVLMGVGEMESIAEQALEAGLDPNTPVAIIVNATMPNQRTVVTTLSRMVEDAKGVEPPAVIVVGEVVRLRDRLRWFD